MTLLVGGIFAQSTASTSKSQTAQSVRSSTDPTATARIQAEATTAAAKINAAAAERVGVATQTQLREASDKQFRATLFTGMAAFAAALAAATNALISRRKLIDERFENARKRLDLRLNDIQLRLANSDPLVRADAIDQLTELASVPDPALSGYWWKHSASYKRLLGLDPGVTATIPPTGTLRASPASRPFFGVASRRIASTILLEEHPAVRSAAMRGSWRLSSIATEELVGISAKLIADLCRRRRVRQLGCLVVQDMASANREAYGQWLRSWAQFTAAANVLEGVTSAFNADPEDEEYYDFPKVPVREFTESEGEYLRRARSARQARLMSQRDPDAYGGAVRWEPNHDFWEIAAASCPLVVPTDAIDPQAARSTTIDFLLEAADDPLFDQHRWVHFRTLESMQKNLDFRETERLDFRRRYLLDSARLIASRDALAGVLRTSPPINWQLLETEVFSNGLVEEFRASFGPELDGVKMPGANLRGACLAGARMTDANVDGGDLRGANMLGADVTGLSAREAIRDPGVLARMDADDAA